MGFQDIYKYIFSVKDISLNLFLLIIFLGFYRYQRTFALKLLVLSFIANLIMAFVYAYRNTLSYFEHEQMHFSINSFNMVVGNFSYVCMLIGILLLILQVMPEDFKVYEPKPGARLFLFILLSLMSLGIVPLLWIVRKYSQQKEKDSGTELLIPVCLFSHALYLINFSTMGSHYTWLAGSPIVNLLLTAGNSLFLTLIFYILIFRIKSGMSLIEDSASSSAMTFLFSVYYLDYSEQRALEQLHLEESQKMNPDIK